MASRAENEKRFQSWAGTLDGGRRYWRDVRGHDGGRARYIKIVDALERTLSFRQEIYDKAGMLRAEHDKYPIDRGHRAVLGRDEGE